MTDKQARGRWFSSPQALFAAAMAQMFPREKGQVPKRQTVYCYTQGPMYYLGQQIVKAMQDAGYPAVIHCCYRSPDAQAEAYMSGNSKALPWESPHQYFEAVDIVHPTKAWKVTPDYWEALAACVRTVAERFGVHLVHGHYWNFVDSAHVQLADWRKAAEANELRHAAYTCSLRDWEVSHQRMPPDEADLRKRFIEVLPQVAAKQWGKPKAEPLQTREHGHEGR